MVISVGETRYSGNGVMKGYLYDVTSVTEGVFKQLNENTDYILVQCVLPGATQMLLLLGKQLTLFTKAVVTIARRVRILPRDVGAAEVRIRALTEAFAQGIGLLAKHVTKCFGKTQISANRLRMETCVRLDLEVFGWAVHDRYYRLASRHGQVPPISEFIPPVVPVWENFISYGKAGGLTNGATPTARAAASATGFANSAGAASSGTCRRWERGGECQYGQACTFVASHTGNKSEKRRTSSRGDKSARDGRKGEGTKAGDGRSAKPATGDIKEEAGGAASSADQGGHYRRRLHFLNGG